MNKKTTWCLFPGIHPVFTLVGLLLIGFLPTGVSHADIGPKPEMEFSFDMPAGSDLTILSGELLECADQACQSGTPLQELGPQGFTCEVNHCSAMAYGFSEFNRLRITFSDGITHESNVFGKRFFSARYQVNVGTTDLLVKEKLGSVGPLPSFYVLGFAGAILLSLFMLAVFIILVLLIIREDQGKNNFKESRSFYIMGWFTALPLLMLSLIISRALILTIILEALVILIYATLRKRSRLTGFTVVLLVNLLSQPPLWFALQTLNTGNAWLLILFGELLVWLFEGVIFYLTQRKSYSLVEALVISLLLNAVSFLVGLLLPL
jgi:hypothetical protein